MDKKIVRTKVGDVVSDINDKTIIVLVSRVKEHPIYKKKYTVTKKYAVHDEKNEYKIGDKVEIIPSKPISKRKRYIVTKKVK